MEWSDSSATLALASAGVVLEGKLQPQPLRGRPDLAMAALPPQRCSGQLQTDGAAVVAHTDAAGGQQRPPGGGHTRHPLRAVQLLSG